MTTCRCCGEAFSSIGLHWYHNPEHRPSLTDKQMDVAKGVLMGDGCIHRSGDSPYLNCSVVERRYLEYLSDIFDNVSGPISREHRATNDIYRWRTKTHPQFAELENWYSTGRKQFPEGLSINPTILKNWYCCDGCYNRGAIEIGISNEVDNRNKIERYFESTPASISNWDVSSGSAKIAFTREDTTKLFQYMGKPLPGFSYKWPSEF